MQPKLSPQDAYNDATIAQGHPADWKNPAGGTYDLVVIGGGPAGLVAALTAASGGKRVALAENRLTGGTCVNFGCTPSKALIRCARAVHESGRAHDFGYSTNGAPQVDFPAVMERVRRMRAMSSKLDSVENLARAGVDVYLGTARFESERSVRVGDAELCFERAVIAAGGRPVPPDIAGLSQADYLTNETVFSLTELPRKLVVLGGGPLGTELAQAFRRLGSEVDLVSSSERLLPKDEPEVSSLLARRFEREGILVHLGFRGTRVADHRLELAGPTGRRILDYDALLVGVGRRADLDGLDLGLASVRAGRRGVVTDAFLRTTNPRIFSAGDASFDDKYTHAAMATARLCVANAFSTILRPASELVIPHCTYTDPEVAHVGRTADGDGSAIEAHRIDLGLVERAYIDGEEDGFAALYTVGGGDRIVGATLVSAHAGETITELTLAIMKGVSLRELAETVHCYPTQAEAFQRIASNWVKAHPSAAERSDWIAAPTTATEGVAPSH